MKIRKNALRLREIVNVRTGERVREREERAVGVSGCACGGQFPVMYSEE